MNGFGRFVRSKWFAVLFFLLLGLGTWFVYEEICAAFRHVGQQPPGWWLLGLFFGLFALYQGARTMTTWFPGRRWVLYVGGIYVTCFFYAALSLLAFQLLACLLAWVVPWERWDMVAFGFACVVALAVCLYGMLHARTVVPVHHTVVAGAGGRAYRIVLLSDIHLGVYNGGRHLQKVVDVVNGSKPDLVVIAGDLFDGSQAMEYVDSEVAAAQFRRIQARDGVVFSTGNHDPATTDEELRTFLQKARITPLYDRGKVLEQLVIFGRNDGSSVCEPDRRRPLQTVMSGYHQDDPVIVVDHNPLGVDEAVACGVDLVLCGHTHGGQMFPINLLTQWAYGKARCRGYHQLGNTHVVVSAGCGVFQLPIRLGTDNEVVCIDLVY